MRLPFHFRGRGEGRVEDALEGVTEGVVGMFGTQDEGADSLSLCWLCVRACACWTEQAPVRSLSTSLRRPALLEADLLGKSALPR